MDLNGKLGNAAAVDASLSDLARGVVGSEILQIAAQIRALKANGAEICNLTVGDFDPAQFPIARGAARRGHARRWRPGTRTTRRRTACSRCARRWRAIYARGSSSRIRSSRCSSPAARGRCSTGRIGRCSIRATWSSIPVPSWNNNHYAYLCGARAIELPVRADDELLPDASTSCGRILSYARLLLLNSPLNPTGTVIDPEVLRAICELVVEENRRRERRAATRQGALALLRPGLLAADVRRRAPRRRRPRSAPTWRRTRSSSTRRRRASPRRACASAGR